MMPEAVGPQGTQTSVSTLPTHSPSTIDSRIEVATSSDGPDISTTTPIDVATTLHIIEEATAPLPTVVVGSSDSEELNRIGVAETRNPQKRRAPRGQQSASPESVGTRSAPPQANSGNAPDRLLLNFDGFGAKGFGKVSRSAVEQELGIALQYFANHGDTAIVERNDGFALRQRYVPNHRGTAVTEFLTEGEAIVGADEMWLSYQVMFEPGWEWVKGGKLPGLAGGRFPSGGRGADGTDGFSARLMWRADGQIVVYAYHPDRPTQFGEDFPTCGTVPTGKWIQITQRIVMNSSAHSYDGGVEVWIDGQLVLSKLDMRWRTNGDFDVDVLAYSSFYGGASRDWSPGKTTYAQFDTFKVSTSPAGIDWTQEGGSPGRAWVPSC